MSSLLQFQGKVDRGGVHLQFTHTTPSQKYIDYPQPDGTVKRNYYLRDSETCGDPTDGIFLPGGKFYPRIWTVVRKPVGMIGCWVQFRYNGEVHAPDLSCPIGTFKIPRDAQPMSNAETINLWTH